MKEKFFNDLKNYLIEREEENLPKLIPYYETLYQNADKLTEVIEDCCRYNHFDFNYYEDKIRIQMYTNEDWNSMVSHHYEILLEDDPRYWGYCDCNPDDEQFNVKYECCGNGCDWEAPLIRVNKMYRVLNASFNGIQRDLWELERKWLNHKEDNERKQILERIEYMDNMIKDYIERKNELLKQLS